ncbi:MAG TPA: tyrosine--tRNA ligase [Acidimicrobiia bacterium]|nr:tyrosine--tRNA ligase [Acidimicrobiia bacterium]
MTDALSSPGHPDPGVDEVVRIVGAGATNLISEADLRKKLARGTPLRVKLGIDPTASDIHLGFAVVLRKLRQFQDLGHTAVLILGDFTAQVGDPTGRSATRPRLAPEQIEANLETYQAQAGLILRADRLEVRRNSEWLGALGADGLLGLAGRATVARMLERDDFSKRYAAGQPISVMELLYPLLQGYDSVVVRADVELGGSDQLFNNLVGRELQEKHGQEPQVVLTTPLLEGLDGVNKMSKSLGNYIGITEPAAEQFGKVMSIPDSLLPRYMLLATGWHPDRVEAETARLAAGQLHPNAAKRLLARTIVDLYHGEGAGAGAEAAFDQVFKKHEVPDDVPEFDLSPEHLVDGRIRLARLVALAGLAASNSEARRKITEGAVRLNGERLSDPEAELAPDQLGEGLLQLGRRSWARVRWLPG